MRARTARAPRPSTVRPLHFPAPVGGLNLVSPASDMPELDCPVLWNMLGSELGLRARSGFVEWATGLPGVAGDLTVRTVMGFMGGAKNGSKDKLFVACLDGIYDVTAGGIGPWARKITFGTQAGDAGYGTWTVETTAADRYIAYWDEENGYHTYTESTDVWLKVTNGAGANQVNAPGDATQYVAGTVFKKRAWMVRKESTVADFFGLQAIYGAPAGQFDFGSQFMLGGILVGLYSWSYDGGSGLQNYLVAVSSGGDIVQYDGLDPTSATSFYLRGTWKSGGVPYGRRIATDLGGDGLVLTSSGVLPLSKLLVGNPIIDRSVYSTQKISPLFTQLAEQQRTLKGWGIYLHPNDAALVVSVPYADGYATNQLAMALSTKGWTRYRDLPMVSGAPWHGKFYFGTADGRVCISTGYVDDVKLADATGQTYRTVDWSMVTRSEKSVLQRIARQVRPSILSGQGPQVNAEARLGYSLNEAQAPAAQQVARAAAALWDAGKWDVDVWGGDLIASEPVFGAAGKGTALAAAVRGSAFSRTILAGVDMLYDDAGFL